MLMTLQALATPKRLSIATMGPKPVEPMANHSTTCVGAIATRM